MYIKSLVIVVLFVSVLIPVSAQTHDSTTVKIICKDYYIELNNFFIGDTLKQINLFKDSIYIIPFDSIGSMRIIDFQKDRYIVIKDYIGTGHVITAEDTFWSPQTNITIRSISRYYEQKRIGIWQNLDKNKKIKFIEIYENDQLVKSIKM